MLTLPPTTAVGSSPACASRWAAIEVVVVLPCEPAIAMPYLSRISSASISARGTTGIFRPRASTTSGLSRRTAVDVTTTSASPTFAASWPDRDAPAELGEPAGGLGLLQVRARDGVAEVEQHLGDAAHADAADPDEVDLGGPGTEEAHGDLRKRQAAPGGRAGACPFVARAAGGGAPAAAHEVGADVGDLLRRLRAPEPPRGARHLLAPLRARQDGADLVREQLAGEVPLLEHHRGARVREALRVLHLVVVGGGGEGDEDRRLLADGQLGERGGPGAADHEVRLGVRRAHVVDELADVGLEAAGAVALLHLLPVARAGLVREAQPRRAGRRGAGSASMTRMLSACAPCEPPNTSRRGRVVLDLRPHVVLHELRRMGFPSW